METLALTKKHVVYPEYMDSGVDWIGEIPKDWKVKKLKWVTRFEYGEPLSDINRQDGDIAVFGSNGIVGFHNYAITEGQTIVIGRKGSAGRVHFSFKSCFPIDTTFYIDKTKTSNELRWLHYVLSVLKLDEDNHDSAIPGLSRENAYSKIISVPEKEVQRKIADYLDTKTAIFDKIIEQKEKLITLLQEKRTVEISSIVNNVVGADERLKFSVIVNPSKQEVSSLPKDYTVSFVPMERISELGQVDPDEKPYEAVKDGFTYFKDGDVVLAKITPCFENGKAGVMQNLKNGIGFGTTEFIVLRPTSNILSQYIYYLIFSDNFRKTGEVEMRGSAGQKRVPENYVRNFVFKRPSIADQKKIVQYLDEKTKEIYSVIAKIQSSIELLQELKSSLIYNVVTGKIKV